MKTILVLLRFLSQARGGILRLQMKMKAYEYGGQLQTYKVNQSHYRPEVPRRFQEVKVPTLRDNGPGRW